MKYKLLSFAFVITIICALLLIATPRLSAFDLFRSSCSGDRAAGSAVCQEKRNAQNDTTSNNVVIRTIRVAANIVALLAGLAAVIMIMLGGAAYITSGGNSDKLATARNRILYSAVGLVVVILAWTIIRFVTDRILA